MSKKRFFIYAILAIVLLGTWFFSTTNAEQDEFSRSVKVALRDAANKLLLSEKDSSSLILPIREVATSNYEVSFQSTLTFEPNNLVSIIEQSFEKAQLPKQYRVEVLQCADKEVAYSYEIRQEKENTIIPCAGRFLPKNCYTIQVQFTNHQRAFQNIVMFICFLVFFVLIVLEFFFFRKKETAKVPATEETVAILGSFHFYPSQNKLIQQTTEISLSKKECELLQIFTENINQIVTREELTKRVWEDNGVIVGRSLDTYVSKLRKKLKDDENIQLTNVHGVGYKLELDC